MARRRTTTGVERLIGWQEVAAHSFLGKPLTGMLRSPESNRLILSLSRIRGVSILGFHPSAGIQRPTFLVTSAVSIRGVNREGSICSTLSCGLQRQGQGYPAMATKVRHRAEEKVDPAITRLRFRSRLKRNNHRDARLVSERAASTRPHDP